MLKVISYAFFGGERRFSFEPILQSNYIFLPGWITRIYHDKAAMAIQGEELKWYESKGLVELVEVNEPGADNPCRSMLWRMKPLYDADVECFLCRDLDSVTLLKDAQIVAAAMKSGAAVWTINENSAHTVPLMGGMIGFNRDAFFGMPDSAKYPTWESLVQGFDLRCKGSDQDLLTDRIWPIAKQSLCEHRIAGFPVTPGAIYSSTKLETTDLPGIPRVFYTRIPHPVYKTDCAFGDSFANYMGASGFRQDDAIAAFEPYAEAFKKDRPIVSQDRTRRVLLASGLDGCSQFFMPLSATLWQKMGYRPVVILGGAKNDVEKSIVYNELKTLAVDVHILTPAPGFSLFQLVALAPHFGHYVQPFPDVLCTASRCEIWPLTKATSDEERVEIGTITAQASTWARFTGTSSEKIPSLTAAVTDLAHRLFTDKISKLARVYDQLKQVKEFRNACADEVHLNAPESPERPHLVWPLCQSTPDGWIEMREVYKELCIDRIGWADDYVDRFFKKHNF